MTAKPVAWVINLDRCAENWARIQRDWCDTFDLRRVSAVDAVTAGITGQAACRQSHLTLLHTLAAGSPAPYHIVIEDDVYKTAEWDTLWSQLRQFLDEGRADWDLMGLDPLLGWDSPALQNFTSILLQSSAFRNTGFLIYNGKSLKKLIDIVGSRGGGAIDMLMCRSPALTKVVPRSLMVRQYTDKPSTISGNPSTSFYNRWYDDTVKILAAFNKDV
jgi:hypothetical protein